MICSWWWSSDIQQHPERSAETVQDNRAWICYDFLSYLYFTSYHSHKNTDLMLQATVLPLCVFSDDNDVDISVPGFDTWQRLAVHHISIQIQSGTAKREDQQKWADGMWGHKDLRLSNEHFSTPLLYTGARAQTVVVHQWWRPDKRWVKVWVCTEAGCFLTCKRVAGCGSSQCYLDKEKKLHLKNSNKKVVMQEISSFKLKKFWVTLVPYWILKSF